MEKGYGAEVFGHGGGRASQSAVSKESRLENEYEGQLADAPHGISPLQGRAMEASE